MQSPELENFGLQAVVVQHPVRVNHQALADFALRNAIAVVAAEQGQSTPYQRRRPRDDQPFPFIKLSIRGDDLTIHQHIQASR